MQPLTCHSVQFWKYAVTGACNNSELRVWSCESWQCHQTLRFVPALQDPPQTPLVFKATMDPSANFLLLSDIHRRVGGEVYCAHLPVFYILFPLYVVNG